MAIKLSELQAIEETITTAPETLTARQVATQAVKNIPGSAIQYGTDIAVALADPIGTAKSIGQSLGAWYRTVSLYQVSKLMNNKQKLLVNILLTDMVVWKILNEL